MALSLLDQFGGAQADARKRLSAVQEAQQQPFRLPNYEPSANAIGSPYARQLWESGQRQKEDVRRFNELNEAESAAAYQDPSRNPAAAFQRILGTSEDFYNQQGGSDPMDAMLREQLMARASGQNQPYDARTINALKVGANEQAAGAEMANNMRAQQSLEQRGFNPGDPGYQAAMARNQLSRQQANQQASLGINQQANLANYQAQGQALSQADAYKTSQAGRQAGALDRLQKNYNQVSVNDLGTAKRFQVPSYSDMMRKS